MPRVLRMDVGLVRGVEVTPQGGLRVPAALTRVGVLQYRDTTGRQWSEYRPPAEVFNADSLSSLRGAPVTHGHPAHLVTAATFRADSVGFTCDDVRQDGNFVAATLVVGAGDVVDAVKAKTLREISCGYECDIDATPGVTDTGERYDAVQRTIRYNHCALLPPGAGRAGPDVALRLDGAAVEVPAAVDAATGHQTTGAGDAQKRERSMLVLKIAGREFKIDAVGDVPAAQGAIDAQAASGSNLMAQVDKLTAALTAALGELAGLKAKMAAEEAAEQADPPADASGADMAEEEVMDTHTAVRRAVTREIFAGESAALKGKTRKDVRTAIAAQIEKRAANLESIRADAIAACGKDFDTKGKSPADLVRAVITARMPTMKLDAMDAKQIATLYAAAREMKPADTTPPRNESLANAHGKVAGVGRADGTDPMANLSPPEKMEAQREANRVAKKGTTR